MVFELELNDFAKRLIGLRENAGVSAREMSLAIGQNESYINNIECAGSFPSFVAFFYICDYLKITPAEFFDNENSNPVQLNELIAKLKKLNAKQLETLSAFVEQMLACNEYNRLIANNLSHFVGIKKLPLVRFFANGSFKIIN